MFQYQGYILKYEVQTGSGAPAPIMLHRGFSMATITKQDDRGLFEAKFFREMGVGGRNPDHLFNNLTAQS